MCVVLELLLADISCVNETILGIFFCFLAYFCYYFIKKKKFKTFLKNVEEKEKKHTLLVQSMTRQGDAT